MLRVVCLQLMLVPGAALAPAGSGEHRVGRDVRSPRAEARRCRKPQGADRGGGAPPGVPLTHGTADPHVPFGGGPINHGRRDRDIVLSAEATMAVFARRNRCDGSATGRIGSVEAIRLTGCAVPTGFLSVTGGGHGRPGGRKALPGAGGPGGGPGRGGRTGRSADTNP